MQEVITFAYQNLQGYPFLRMKVVTMLANSNNVVMNPKVMAGLARDRVAATKMASSVTAAAAKSKAAQPVPREEMERMQKAEQIREQLRHLAAQ